MLDYNLPDRRLAGLLNILLYWDDSLNFLATQNTLIWNFPEEHIIPPNSWYAKPLRIRISPSFTLTGPSPSPSKTYTEVLTLLRSMELYPIPQHSIARAHCY